MNDCSGHGIGLRAKHYREIGEQGLDVPWVEAITENFLGRGGHPPAVLERVRRDANLAFHGVSLSIGATDPLDLQYLDGLSELIRRYEPEVISDHLCFSSFGGHRGHDLWPVPYTEESLAHVAARVSFVQDRLGRRIALENPSRYIEFAGDTLSEWQYYNALTRQTGCGVLLDVNNVYVSAHNLGFDAEEYLDSIRLECVLQMHVAGHSSQGAYLLDDHGSVVSDAVWALLARACRRGANAPVIMEWDGDVPALSVIVEQAGRALDVTRQARQAA